jgi:hypothetical protein
MFDLFKPPDIRWRLNCSYYFDSDAVSTEMEVISLETGSISDG